LKQNITTKIIKDLFELNNEFAYEYHIFHLLVTKISLNKTFTDQGTVLLKKTFTDQGTVLLKKTFTDQGTVLLKH